MKPKTAEYYRAYRAKNRERILAQDKARRAKRTPEQRQKDLERKRKWREKVNPQAGIGRGHGHHANSLAHMTAEERKAHKAAQIANWREAHKDYCREYNRRHYLAHKRPSVQRLPPTEDELRLRRDRLLKKKREYSLRWRDQNYQTALQREREAHRRHRDKSRKRDYKEVPSSRVPEWVQNPAHARYLMKCADQRRRNTTVDFATAIQSGLTVGRYSA